MKKVFASAFIIGLIGAPSAAFAMQGHGADDTIPETAHPQTTNVRQEDRRDDAAENHNGVNSLVFTPNTINSTTTTSLSEAKAIAQSHFPNKTITKVEVETEHGAQVFSVRFSDGSRVDVTLKGEIVRSEDENNHDDDNSNSGLGHVENENETHINNNDGVVHEMNERD